MRKLIDSFKAGLGVVLGYALGKHIVDTLKNPVKRATLKKKFKNIKNEMFKKD